MKTLIPLLFLLLLSCEREKLPVECATCYHLSVTIREGNYTTQRWGDFTACGDTIAEVEKTYYRVQSGDCEIIELVVCE